MPRDARENTPTITLRAVLKRWHRCLERLHGSRPKVNSVRSKIREVSLDLVLGLALHTQISDRARGGAHIGIREPTAHKVAVRNAVDAALVRIESE